MRTAETPDTHAEWAAAHDRRRRCARPDCPHEREDAQSLCFTCTLEAELFDRDARWASAAARRRLA
jgi:hypothetical protein